MGTVTHLHLRTLGDETWGQRFRRAREESGLALRDIAAAVGRVSDASHTMISNLEKQPHAPRRARNRRVAFIALIAMGFDPLAFGLTPDDLPASMTPEWVAEQVKRSSGWITADSPRLAA